jgi:hypothetical protein
MITENKIKVFNKYNGDINSWVKSGSKKEESIMSDHEWYLIESFIQDIRIIKKGLASKENSENLNKNLVENCDSVETINQLKNLANKEW